MLWSLVATTYLDAVIKEQFLGFANLDDLSASPTAHEILTRLTSLGISIKSWVGHGYDEASVMSGKSNGVQSIIKKSSSCSVRALCESLLKLDLKPCMRTCSNPKHVQYSRGSHKFL